MKNLLIMQFSKGEIIHVPKFVFPDGTIKETGKFLLILHITKEKSILINLATSQKAYLFEGSSGGCFKHELSKRLTGYHFNEKQEICTNGFYFKKNTFLIASAGIIKQSISELTSKHKGIQRKGVLKKKFLIDVLDCTLKNIYIKRIDKNIIAEDLKRIRI